MKKIKLNNFKSIIIQLLYHLKKYFKSNYDPFLSVSVRHDVWLFITTLSILVPNQKRIKSARPCDLLRLGILFQGVSTDV